MAETRDRLQSAVSEVWERFRGRTLERLEVLEQAAVALLEQRLEPELRRTAEREAHKLAGAVGTFGFAEGSRLARAAEQLLEGSAPLPGAAALELSELVVALRQELESAPAAPAEPEPEPERRGNSKCLWVITGDDEYGHRLLMEAAGRGLAAHAVDSQQPTPPPGTDSPERVLLDLPAGENARSCIQRLREGSPPVDPRRIFVLTDRDGFDDRVGLTRLGVGGVIPKPCSPSSVIDAVVESLSGGEGGPARILSVDDDPQIRATVEALLGPTGAEVRTLGDPAEYWDVLESWRPDLVVLDEDMPGWTGIDLCRVTRCDPRWRSLPILFLTARTDPESISRIFAAGADDYVPKPVFGPELVTRIENRLERVRLYQLLADTDGLTGVPNRRKSEEMIERLLALAARQRESLALVAIDLDEFKRVNDLLGHAVGDDVLRRLARTLRHGLRGEDAIGRWGGEEFVLAMYGISKATAARRIQDLLDRFRGVERAPSGDPVTLSFSAGVAEHPEDGRALDELYRAADAALYQAKEQGRSRVICAGGASPPATALDVALVEDDPVLAELLLHTLHTQGYRTAWLQDGEAAIEALTGEEARLSPRLILLDVDLPGRDGMAVLSELARTGVTRRARVIMLTVRSTEPDVLRALEAGAADFVAKPFSVPVLLRRIEAALEGR